MVSGWSLEVLSFHAYKITETWGAMKILSLSLSTPSLLLSLSLSLKQTPKTDSAWPCLGCAAHTDNTGTLDNLSRRHASALDSVPSESLGVL